VKDNVYNICTSEGKNYNIAETNLKFAKKICMHTGDVPETLI
jgi:hypothetical protein